MDKKTGPQGVDFLTAGAYGIEGIGSLIEGFQMQDAYSYNADILSSEANSILTIGELDVDKIGKAEDLMLGTQKAMYAKAGVTMAGSPTDTALQTATNFEFDKLVTRYNAKVQSKELESKASMEKFYGRQAAHEGVMNLGKSLLSAGVSLL